MGRISLPPANTQTQQAAAPRSAALPAPRTHTLPLQGERKIPATSSPHKQLYLLEFPSSAVPCHPSGCTRQQLCPTHLSAVQGEGCMNQQYLRVRRKLHTGHRRSVQGAMSCPKPSPLSVQKKTQSGSHVNAGFMLGGE